MGKAEILSGGTDGLYRINIKYGTEAHKARIESLEQQLEATAKKLDEILSRIDDAGAALDAAQQVLKQAIRDKDQTAMQSAVPVVQKKQGALNAVVAEQATLRLQQTSIQKQIEFLNENVREEREVDAWCADLSEGLTGEVGTIECGRMDGPVIIRPGHESAAYQESDGQLQDVMAMSAAAAFYNYALLPGVTKWKPRYRTGVISNIDTTNNTCSVRLDSLRAAGLSVNQVDQLSAVPVEYMTCNASAFIDDDHVIVGFVESVATVIGFVDNPASCGLVEIYLAGVAGAYGLYSYTADTMRDFVESGSANAEQLYEKQVLAGAMLAEVDNMSAAFSDSCVVSHTHCAVDFAHSTAYLTDGLSIGVHTDELDTTLGTLPATSTWAPETMKFSGQFLFIAGYENKDLWNVYRGANFHAYNAPSGSFFDSWRWSPAIFYAEPRNEQYLIPGLYYGDRVGGYLGGGEDGGIELAASNIKVRFCAIMETRSERVLYARYGYCELLTEIDGSEFCSMNFFHMYSAPQTVSNVSDYNLSLQEYVGTHLSPPHTSFRVDLSDYFTGLTDPETHHWNTEAPSEDPLAVTPVMRDMMGCVVAKGGRAVLIRLNGILGSVGFGGTAEVIFDTNSYHSHSVSSNGRIVSVFEGVGHIDRVHVFDLVAQFDFEYAERAEVEPWERLRESTLVNSVGANSAALIPQPWSGYEGTLEDFDFTVELSESTPYEPTLGGVYLPRFKYPNPEEVWKIVCDDGVHAEAFLYEDICQSMRMTIVQPSGDRDSDVTITVGAEPEKSGTFAEVAPDLPYRIGFVLSAEIDGLNAVYLANWKQADGGAQTDIIEVSGSGIIVTHGRTEPPEIAIQLAVGGGYTVIALPLGMADVLGDITWDWLGDSYWGVQEVSGSDQYCDVGPIREVPECTTFYGGKIEVKTSCGQEATYEIEGDDVEEFSVSQDDEMVTVTGGQEPYYVTHDDVTVELQDNPFDVSSVCEDEYSFEDSCGRSLGGFSYDSFEKITVSGDSTPEINDLYSATGGCWPYTYTISCGEIDDSGIITNLDGCCGTGYVTATDALGRSATLEVRFPSGQWVLESAIAGLNNYTNTYTYYVGGKKIFMRWYNGYSVGSTIDGPSTPCAEGGGYHLCVDPYGGDPMGAACDEYKSRLANGLYTFRCWSYHTIDTYTWECL